MKLVVLGAPGAGKGTQGRNLANYYGIAHISTGDLLRAEIANQTDIGISISERMDKGLLLPDVLVTGLLEERLKLDDCKNGFILDGYPRTIEQAFILDEFIDGTIDGAVSVDVDDDVIIERMSGRYMCSDCGSIYHLHYHPPKNAGICDLCGGKLIQREDDKARTVKLRLQTYHEITEPIIEYYRNKGLLTTVSGIGDIGEITNSIVLALGDGK